MSKTGVRQFLMQEDTSNVIHRVRERVVVGEGHDTWFDGM
jgi:hypothetical protein